MKGRTTARPKRSKPMDRYEINNNNAAALPDPPAPEPQRHAGGGAVVAPVPAPGKTAPMVGDSTANG